MAYWPRLLQRFRTNWSPSPKIDRNNAFGYIFKRYLRQTKNRIYQKQTIFFAKNLETRNIIKLNLKSIRQLKSGKVCFNEPNTTLAQKLSRICVQETLIKTFEEFDPREFCILRVMVKKVIASKIKHNNKKVTNPTKRA